MSKYLEFQSEIDENDIVYGNIEFKNRSKDVLPNKFKLQCTDVKHQGGLGSCVGQALSTIMECDAMVKHDKSVGWLSPLFAYANAKKVDGKPNIEGTVPRSALDALKKNGICEEKLYPYTDNQEARKGIFPAISNEAIENAKLYKPTGYAAVSKRVEDIKKAIYYENGVMICVKVFRNFEDTYRGFLKPPKGSFVGNHALAIVGWDDDLEQIIEGKKYKGFFLLKDSYGNDKGRHNGYFYLAYDGLRWKNVYDVDCLVKELWTTFDTTKVKNKTFHIDKFDGVAINPIKKELKLKLGSKDAYIDGIKKTMLAAPVVKNNVTFVPVRFIAENLECRVDYTPETKGIRIYESNKKLAINMTIGKLEAMVDGKQYIMLEPPYIENGSTLLPLRAIGEMLGYQVYFDARTKEITIKG